MKRADQLMAGDEWIEDRRRVRMLQVVRYPLPTTIVIRVKDLTSGNEYDLELFRENNRDTVNRL